MVDHVVEFDRYTEPMKQLLAEFAADPKAAYVVSSAHPRLVDGKPSKNPRYLQKRPDLVNPRELTWPKSPRGWTAISRRRDRFFAGQRRAAWPPQQSAGPKSRDSRRWRSTSDPLPGTAGAVHGVHLRA